MSHHHHGHHGHHGQQSEYGNYSYGDYGQPASGDYGYSQPQGGLVPFYPEQRGQAYNSYGSGYGNSYESGYGAQQMTPYEGGYGAGYGAAGNYEGQQYQYLQAEEEKHRRNEHRAEAGALGAVAFAAVSESST